MSPQSTLNVIVYCYGASPYAKKVEHILALKQIPYQTVHVDSTLPRPAISELLSIQYRRIPILAIGNDVYCDTSLIIAELERRFPALAGYTTIFPPRKHGRGADTGAIKAFSQFYADAVLFPLATRMTPWEKLPESFIRDRSNLLGAPINVQAIVAQRDATLSQLSSHFALLEEQLMDKREWLFDTEHPGLADVSVYFVLSWLKRLPGLESLYDQLKFPHLLEWLNRLATFFAQRTAHGAAPEKLTGDQAAQIIMSSPGEDPGSIGFDHTEAGRLGLAQGQSVEIAPTDTGRNRPTRGKLVALSRKEVVILVNAAKGNVQCHFPRLGFFTKPVQGAMHTAL